MMARYLVVSILIADLVLCFVSIVRAGEKPDLIFYMSFDNMSGNAVKDDSGNENTGALKGDSKIVKGGKFGSALSVSGEGYVDCGNREALNQAFPGLTIEAWIYPTAISGIQQIVSKWQWTVAGDHFALGIVDGVPGICVADGLVAAQVSVLGQTTIRKNQWYHVAGIWDASTFEERVYVNGKLDRKGPQSDCKGINTKSTENLKIGGQVTGTGRYLSVLLTKSQYTVEF